MLDARDGPTGPLESWPPCTYRWQAHFLSRHVPPPRAGIEMDEDSGLWKVVDANRSIWAESNWPAEMYTAVYPHGSHSFAEAVGMLSLGIFNSLVTVGVVHAARRYHTSYKRL